MTDYIVRSKITEARKAFCHELYKELFGRLDNDKERPMTKEEKAFFGYNKKFAQLINSIPAADVVEVVRCGQCTYACSPQVVLENSLGRDIFLCSELGRFVKGDWFCADGERRGDDE